MRVLCHLIFINIFIISLASCGGGSDTSSEKMVAPSGEGADTSSEEIVAPKGSVIAVTYSKGPVTGATAVLLDTNRNIIAGPVTTVNGQASFTDVQFEDLVFAKFLGGSYVDEATGIAVELANSFEMRSGVINNLLTGNFKLTATPLTEIAFQRAEMTAGGAADLATVNTFLEEVADEFGLDGINLTQVAPTPLQDISGVGESDRYGTILAAITQFQLNAGDIASEATLASYISGSVAGVDGPALVSAINDLKFNPFTSSFITNDVVMILVSNLGMNGEPSPEIPNTDGTGINDALITQRNFLIEFSDVAPAFFDLAANTTTATTSDVTVRIADNNNQIITAPKTIFFETEWGFIEPSCETNAEGSCTVTWRSGNGNDTALIGFKNTIVAYSSKSGETGQESFFDANGNGSFNDGETASDLDEPFIDRDDSGTFTTGDKVIDTINGVDSTGTDGLHNGGDGFYNGPDCSHSSLCSTTRAISTVWNSGSLQLTGADQFTIGGQVTGLVGTVTIQNNGADNIIILAAFPFIFATAQTPGEPYNVTIFEQPAGAETCTVINNGIGIAGTGPAGDITNVSITCN